jgi:hypothetical protein
VGSPEANVMRAGARHRKFAGGLPSGLYAALSVEETGEALQIPKETVKTRLLRARRRLQKSSILRSARRCTTLFLSRDGAAMRLPSV